jgi:hypothetical protein
MYQGIKNKTIILVQYAVLIKIASKIIKRWTLTIMRILSSSSAVKFLMNFWKTFYGQKWVLNNALKIFLNANHQKNLHKILYPKNFFFMKNIFCVFVETFWETCRIFLLPFFFILSNKSFSFNVIKFEFQCNQFHSLFNKAALYEQFIEFFPHLFNWVFLVIIFYEFLKLIYRTFSCIVLLMHCKRSWVQKSRLDLKKSKLSIASFSY